MSSPTLFTPEKSARFGAWRERKADTVDVSVKTELEPAVAAPRLNAMQVVMRELWPSEMDDAPRQSERVHEERQRRGSDAQVPLAAMR